MAYTVLSKGQITSAKLETLAAKMDWSRREALGCVTLLWHGAQSLETDKGTREQIAIWCLIDIAEEEYVYAFIEALKMADYIFEVQGTVDYFIKDMERQLVSVRRSRSKPSKKERSAGPSQGATSTSSLLPSVFPGVVVPEVELREEEKPSDASLLEIKEIDSEKIHVKEIMSAVEKHAEQGRLDLAVPNKTRRKKSPETEEEKKARLMKATPGAFVWQAYKEAYFARYTIEPQRNAKASTCSKNICERIGVDNALEVVKYYLTREDAFYVNSAHEIGLCLRDCQKLVTEMKTRKPMSLSEARRRETSATTDQAIQGYLKSQGGTQ